jgi:hypothetical protein
VTLTPGGPVLFVDLSNLCRDTRLLAAGVDADLTVLERFRLAVEQSNSISVGRIHCIADRSLFPLLAPKQKRIARELEQSGELEFSALADERLLSLAFDDEEFGQHGLVASMDYFDDFRRTFPQIQGSTDRFVGWTPDEAGMPRVEFRNMGVHSHRRLSRKEESAEFKARRLRRDSVVQRATATYFRCASGTCLVAQLWPHRLPELPQFDDVNDQFVCPSCEGPLEIGEVRPHATQLVVFLNGVEQVRIMIDDGDHIDIGRKHGDRCFGLEAALGTEATSAISRRHLRATVHGGRLSVEELESRNGSVLRRDGTETPLSAGDPRGMRPTDVVALPSGITIELSGRTYPRGGERAVDEPASIHTDRATRLLRNTRR